MLTPWRAWLTRAGRWLPSPSDTLLALVSLLTLLVSLQYSDDAVCVHLNLGLFCVPFLLTALLGGRLRSAAAVACALGLLVWGVGETKMQFFRQRLGLMDFYFLSGGANWAIVERYPEMQRALASWLLLSIVLGFAAWRSERGRALLAGRWRVLTGVLLLGWCAGSWAARHHHQWEVFRDDADCGEQKICGVMARLVYSYCAFEFIPPASGADSSGFQRAAALLVAAPPAPPAALPDVVVWLNESTLDPSQYLLPSAELPALPMFQTSARTVAAGQLRVHTFGGRTWLSEFSLLTGLVPADFGARKNLVFNGVAPEVSSTLVHRFEAAGYDTLVLMPTSSEFYGAGRTYAQIGFDRILTLRDFHEYDQLEGGEWEISDSPRMAETAIKLLREHRAESARPLFIYMLSIREHGPYLEDTKVGYGLERAGLRPSLAARLTDYVDRLRALDTATALLEHALTSSARPALWAYFGDHQANFGEPQPGYRYDLADPELITQYQLRANYELPRSPALALLDIALLPSLIVDSAGIAPDAYFKAQTAMRRLCDGRLRDCPEAGLVDSYKGYIFDAALGLFGSTLPEAPLSVR